MTFFIVAMSLFHAPFQSQKQALRDHKKNYRPLVKERNKLQDSLLKELGVSLSIEEYKKQRRIYWQSSQKKIRAYTSTKNEIQAKHRFLTSNSFKHWFFRFGIFITLLYFSLVSLKNDLKKELKTGHFYASIGGIIVSVFWLIQVFFKKADYEIESYIGTVLVIATFISLFIYFFFNYLIKKENLLQTIRGLFDFILVETEEKDLIKEAKKEYYEKRKTEIIKKALDNE